MTTIAEAMELCEVYYKKGIPTMVEGAPGIGKSEMYKQLSEKLKVGFIDLRLTQMDPVDLRGLPAIHSTPEAVYTTWARPDFWPVVERDGERGIILFDELADSGRAMQSAAYQIILDGRAGPHIIPPGWYRCAAGNSQKDKAGAQAMSSALANRFAWLPVEAEINCFLDYGLKAGIHHFILGFLKFRPGLLHKMDEANLKAFPSPRSWSKASRVCGEPARIRSKLIAGCVGEGPAGEFEAYMRTLDLPDLAEILADPKKCRIPEQPSSRYALAAMLSRNATKENFGKIDTYVSRKQFGREHEIVTILEASKRDPNLTDSKTYGEFAVRNSDIQL